MWVALPNKSSFQVLSFCVCLITKIIAMAKFNGEVTFKVKFKNLGVPVGFGMTNSIIFHECATQIYVRSGWCKIDRKIKDKRFEVEIVDKKITF